jgi:hypothetical protein
MKTYEEVDVEIHIFLTLALVGGDRSASHPGLFTIGKGPQSSLDTAEKRKFLTLLGREFQPLGCPAP